MLPLGHSTIALLHLKPIRQENMAVEVDVPHVTHLVLGVSQQYRGCSNQGLAQGPQPPAMYSIQGSDACASLQIDGLAAIIAAACDADDDVPHVLLAILLMAPEPLSYHDSDGKMRTQA